MQITTVKPLPLAVICLVSTALAISVGAFLTTFGGEDTNLNSGPLEKARIDGVVINITIDKVDPLLNKAQATWWLEPGSNISSDSALTQDVRLSAPELSEDDVVFKAGTQKFTRTTAIDLATGDSILYPFDSYSTIITAIAESSESKLPTYVTINELDPGFTISNSIEAEQIIPTAKIELTRTTTTQAFAVLMLVVMWALAWSVAAAAYVIWHKNSGLIWPAMSWMAATLFALVAFRNAAPGAPPLGCLLDLTAFFWAEGIIAISLITTVVRGVANELKLPNDS